MSLEAIKYEDGKLTIIDQLRLPEETVYLKIETLQDAWNAINKMQVRGAPAIAVVGCLALASHLESGTSKFSSKSELSSWMKESLDFLLSARPTAVNLQNASKELRAILKKHKRDDDVQIDDLRERVLEHIITMMEKDVADNIAIGENGAQAIVSSHPGVEKLKILTHCNTGSLATCGYGTALGVVRSLRKAGKLDHVYCTETRPYNQGARLTAYELVHDGLPATLICDSMAGALMKSKGIHAVVTGADRVAGNGDTANKIGTYQLAVLAKHHGVPFYIAAPFTSIDFGLAEGGQIKIEERPGNELTHIQGLRIAAHGIGVWNPAFDVTPAELITGGIITERGVFPAAELPKI